MKATIIGTLDATNKRQVKGFNILEIDGDLLKQQEDQPLDVTGNCRERRSNFPIDMSELFNFDGLEDADADATKDHHHGNNDRDERSKGIIPIRRRQ
jgi:hypothetical protein